MTSMAAVPVKPEYGPTMGRLLSPWWRARSRAVQALVLALVAAALAGAVGIALTFLNNHYSHGGPVAFSFSYRSLDRTTPEPGGYVRVISRRSDGSLHYSYSVAPLTVGPHSGLLSGDWPVLAAPHLKPLEATFQDFALRAQGKTRVNGVAGYEFLFHGSRDGQALLGRDILLLPEKPGARKGVSILLLAAPAAGAENSSALEVASNGVLVLPLKTFTFH